MDPRASRRGDVWHIDGDKPEHGPHRRVLPIFARTSGSGGDGHHHGFPRPDCHPVLQGGGVIRNVWTFTCLPTTGCVALLNVRLPHRRCLGCEGRGLQVDPTFSTRITAHPAGRLRPWPRSTASRRWSTRRSRSPSANAALSRPSRSHFYRSTLRELAHNAKWRDAARSAHSQDVPWSGEQSRALLGVDKVSMWQTTGDRQFCEAADRAMFRCTAAAGTRDKPFAHIYRHHRRYRITRARRRSICDGSRSVRLHEQARAEGVEEA